MRQSSGYILLSILFVLLQTTIARYLAIENIAPDLLLIWVVYLALREGQSTATTAGFFLGLLFDLISGKDGMLGLAALCKTVAGFAAGYFYNENKTLLTLASYRFLLIVLLVSVLQNTVYFIIYAQGSEISLLRAVFQVGLATAFYTTTWTLLPMFAFARKALR